MSVFDVSGSVAPREYFHWCEDSQELTIDFTTVFGYPCQLVIQGWQKQCAWYSVIYGEIEYPETYSDPGVYLLGSTDDEAIIQWQQTIPETIRTALMGGRHWFPLLRMIALHEEARDLQEGNPLLLWLWFCHCQDQQISDDAMIAGLRQKQAMLLQTMGLAASPGNARLLRRVSANYRDEIFRRRVVALWNSSSALAMLRHCPLITEVHINLLCDNPLLRELPLFYAIVNQDCAWRQAHAIDNLRDCIRMGLREVVNRCRTIESLQRIHDRHARLQNAGRGFGRLDFLKDENGAPLPFPAPPHPGTSQITPITTPDDLQCEGQEMMHCVGSYIRTVQEGDSYIYRMIEPQRVTIGVSLRGGGIFSIKQIAGVKNSRPTTETKELVMEWFTVARQAS